MNRVARVVSLGALLCVLTASPAGADATLPPDAESFAPPRVTAVRVTPAPLWVNQKAEIEVTLWRDDAQANKPAPDFGEIRVRNAIALRTDYAPPPDVRDKEGVRYLLQKRRYVVFPQAVGVVEVPPIEVSWATDGRSRARVRSAPLTFEAKLPPSAGSDDYLVAASVTAKESIDGNLRLLRVGDSFTRTITVSALDTDAMMIPPAPAGSQEGLAAYPSAPEVTTRIERGRYKAKRIDSVTYVAEEWGSYELPPFDVRWFNPRTGKWNIASVKARSFRVHLNPQLGLSAFGAWGDASRRAGGLIVALLLAWGAHLLWRRRVRTDVRSRREPSPPGPSEERLFWRIQRLAYRGDAVGTLNATYAWIAARERAGHDARTIEALAEQCPDVAEPAVELQRVLFSACCAGQAWEGQGFASSIRKARGSTAPSRAHHHGKLLPLNPARPDVRGADGKVRSRARAPES